MLEPLHKKYGTTSANELNNEQSLANILANFKTNTFRPFHKRAQILKDIDKHIKSFLYPGDEKIKAEAFSQLQETIRGIKSDENKWKKLDKDKYQTPIDQLDSALKLLQNKHSQRNIEDKEAGNRPAI